MFFHRIKICLKLLLQPVNLQACLPIHMRLLGCLTISLCLPAILQWSRVKRPTKPCQSRLSIPGAAVDPGGSHPHHLSKPRFGRTPPSGSGLPILYLLSLFNALSLTHIPPCFQVLHRLSELVSGFGSGLTLPLLHLYSAEVFPTSRRFLLATSIQVYLTIFNIALSLKPNLDPNWQIGRQGCS